MSLEKLGKDVLNVIMLAADTTDDIYGLICSNTAINKAWKEGQARHAIDRVITFKFDRKVKKLFVGPKFEYGFIIQAEEFSPEIVPKARFLFCGGKEVSKEDLIQALKKVSKFEGPKFEYDDLSVCKKSFTAHYGSEFTPRNVSELMIATRKTKDW